MKSEKERERETPNPFIKISVVMLGIKLYLPQLGTTQHLSLDNLLLWRCVLFHSETLDSVLLGNLYVGIQTAVFYLLIEVSISHTTQVKVQTG